MKAVKRVFLLLTMLLTTLAFTNLASASGDVRKELEAVYAKIDAAVKNKDVKALESLLGKDYEKQAGDKTLDRAETVAEMKKNFEKVKEIKSAKTVIDKIQHVEGNEIVDYTQTVNVVVTTPDGKDNSIEITSKGRDWWIKEENGNWICINSERIE